MSPIVSGGGGGGSQLVLRATRTLTSAEIRALYATPIEITAVPAAGHMFVPIQVWFASTFGTKAYRPGNVHLHISTIREYTIESNGGQWGITAKEGLLSLLLSATCGLDFTDDASLAGLNGQALAVLVNSSLARGPILTSALNAGGAGYAPGDTGTVDGSAASAIYAVDTVSGGAVVTYHLTSAGTDYAAPTIGATTTAGESQPGVGTGFTVNITAVTQGDGGLTITTYYTDQLVPT